MMSKLCEQRHQHTRYRKQRIPYPWLAVGSPLLARDPITHHDATFRVRPVPVCTTVPAAAEDAVMVVVMIFMVLLVHSVHSDVSAVSSAPNGVIISVTVDDAI